MCARDNLFEDSLRDGPNTEELVEPVVYVLQGQRDLPLLEGEPCLVRFEAARSVSVWSIIVQVPAILGIARQSACHRSIPLESGLGSRVDSMKR